MRSMHTLMTAALAGAAMFGTIGAAAAQTQLKVMVFPGGFSRSVEPSDLCGPT